MFNEPQNQEKFLAGTISPRPKHNHWNFAFVIGILVLLTGLSGVIWFKLQKAALKTNVTKAQNLLSSDPIDSLVIAIYTTGQNQRLTKILPWTKMSESVQFSLRQAIDHTEQQHLFQHQDSVHSVSFRPADQQVIVSSDGNGIQLRSSSGEQIGKLLPNEKVTTVISSDDGKTIALVIDHKIIRLLDREGNYLESFSDKKGKITSLAFSPDGQYLLSGNQDKILKLWDLEGNPILSLRGHEGAIDSVAFSPNGNYLLSGSHNDGTIRLWDLNGQLTQTFAVGKYILSSLTFSPEGKTIVIGGTDGKVRIWNVKGHLVKILSGHDDTVSSVAFNPDGHTFISSSLDETIRLWSDDGALIRTLQGHDTEVHAVAFSTDGKKIISGGKDGKVRLWTGGNWKDWLEEGCKQLQNEPVLQEPQSKEAKGARKTCQPYISQQLAKSQNNKPSDTEVANSQSKNAEGTKTSAARKTIEVAKTSEVTPQDFQPSAKAIAKHYHHRGSERADLKLIEKFTKIVNNPAASTTQKTNAYINRGVIYFRDRKYAQAIDSYTKALRNASEQQLIHIYVNRGIAYSSLPKPKHELAIEDYNQAIKINSQYFDAYVERGITWASLGKYQAAMADYNKAIALKPNNPDVHYARGFTLALQPNKQKDAIEAYRQAAKLYRQQGKREYAQNTEQKIAELHD